VEVVAVEQQILLGEHLAGLVALQVRMGIGLPTITLLTAG
jgi:hypothetical protein